jgi:hypothetical protein
MEAGRGVENVPPPRQMPPTIASQPATRQQEVMHEVLIEPNLEALRA